jgi:CHASE3 domain sensor protein
MKEEIVKVRIREDEKDHMISDLRERIKEIEEEKKKMSE